MRSQHFRWICEGEFIAVLCAEDFFGVKIVNAGRCDVNVGMAREVGGVDRCRYLRGES